MIIARGPISRALSAFNWRYKLVVEDKVQKDRYSGEYEVLKKYGSLNRLAESLYDPDGRPNRAVHKEIRKIHHIREDIAFYLKDFLKFCPPAQISAVLMQENLDSDMQNVLGIGKVERKKDNRGQGRCRELSETAERNLKRFFFDDYQALLRLYCYGKIDKDILIKAI
ncbi:MAG: hypothetical protein K9K81_08140 [Desulfobacteraceae bacterium]|nr:hypothetical protein [Desulfobacteraceae bacterium]